jgi:hypothetical protein
MQKSVKSADLEAARRSLRGLAQRVSTVRIATDTGIHQSQVSRLLRGHFKRLSPNVQSLLDYASKPRRYGGQTAAQELAKASLIKATLRTWDATPEGAQALVRLLRIVENIRRLGPARKS